MVTHSRPFTDPAVTSRRLLGDNSWQAWLPVMSLVLLAFALRVHFAAGFIPADDAEYARVAARVLDGTFSWETHEGPPVNPARIGLVIPLIALFYAFGPNEVSMAAYTLFLSLVTTVLIYLFTARVFGRAAGLFALAIWTFIPLDIEFAARVNPDTPVTAFAFLALFVAYKARTRAEYSPRDMLTSGVLAGLALGIGWLSKASVVYFGPFFLLLALYDLRRDYRHFLPLWCGIAAGSALVFAAEMVYYVTTTGDALYRFYTIERNYELYPQFFFNEGAQWGYEAGTPYWKAVVKRLFLEGPSTFFLRDDYLYLPAFGLIAAGWGIYKRDARYYFPAALLVSLLFMFNFFSASIANYQPLPLFTRYSHSLCFVGAMLTGGLLGTLLCPGSGRARFAERPDGLFWGSVIVIFFATAAGWTTFRKIRDVTTTWASAERTLSTMIGPADHVYTDPLSRASLEFFWGYPQSMNITRIGQMRPDDRVQCNSYVLINSNYVNWLTYNFGMWYTLEPFELTEELKAPPESWSRVWSNGITNLYRVECGDG